MSEQPRILVVDDDSDVRWMLQRYLGKHGFAVEVNADGTEMRAMPDLGAFDLIILDLSLPGEDGLSLARFLREHHSMAIIMLTAASEVVDRVIGLEVGADDYVTKPFEPRELLARIRSVLRRSVSSHGPESADGDGEHVRFGQCQLDVESHRLINRDGEEIAITSMEYDLLKAFADHPNKVLSRDQLLNLAHNRDWDPYDRSIDIRIARLRRKIERDPSKPEVIKTVRGAGYMFASGS